MKLPRSFFIPSNFSKFYEDPSLGVVVYSSDPTGNLAAMCFVGKQNRPAWFYTFKTADLLFATINKTLEDRRGHAARMATERARRTKPHDVKVGNIFKASWGYDQTNVDFYAVTKVTGAHTIQLEQIGSITTEQTTPGSYRVKPDPTARTGKFITKRVTDWNGTPSIRVASYATAHRVDPTATHYASDWA